MIRYIFLDTGPLGLIFQQKKSVTIAEDCRQWVRDWEYAGATFVVPAIADFEVRRELIRLQLVKRVAALDRFNSAASDRYLPLTDSALRLAADLWAQTRQSGRATADARELDCDVLIASQVLDLRLPLTDFVIATVNVGHLSLFAPADHWQNVKP